MMKYLIKPIIKHHYLTVIIICAITAFMGYQLKYLRIDNDVMNTLPDDHPTKIAQKEMEEDFGAADMILIGLETDNIFNTEFLEKVKILSKKIKKIRIESDPFTDPETGEIITKRKRAIANVISLSTMSHIEGSEYGMEVSTLMGKAPKNNEEMERLKEKVFSWDFYIGNIVSSDSKATIIGIEYKKGLSPDEGVRMADAVTHLVEEARFGKDVKIYIAGTPFALAMVTKNMMKDLTFMVPAVFGVVCIFLIFTMRRISSVILIFVTIATSVLWTMGIMSLLGIYLNISTSAIPVLLVAIGSAYSIHIINHYSAERAEGKNAAKSAENSITIVGISVFGAALTTIAGFMSLMASNLMPIHQFGLFTGVGTGVAFIVSVIFVPALLLSLDRLGSYVPKRDKVKEKTGVDLVPFFISLSNILTKNHKILFSLSLLVILISFIFTLKVRPDLNMIGVFKKYTAIRQADSFLCKKFSGTTTMVVTLEADEDDYFKNPDALRKLDNFSTYMKEDPVVGTVISLAVPIKRMNYAMNQNQKEYDAIPETKQHVAQYLILNSDPEALEGMVTSDYRKARIVVMLKDGEGITLNRINKRVQDWLDRETHGLKVQNCGSVKVVMAMNDLIVTGQIRSLVFSIILVLIISSIILRSFVGGLLAVMPLGISVILNFGIIGILDIPLDMGTATISAMAIGIAVDYSIHLLNGIKHGVITKGLDNCVDEGIKITGNAITFNAFSVGLGFLVLTFSSFNNLTKLGAFVALTMVTAWAGTMLLIPALVNTFKLGRYLQVTKNR
jgi:predicted RND superfamily exporter protein